MIEQLTTAAALGDTLGEKVITTARQAVILDDSPPIARMVLDSHDAGLYAAGAVATKAAFWLPQAIGVVLYPKMANPEHSAAAVRSALGVLVALGVVIVLAIPMLSLRQGFADDSGKPVGSPARIAYDLRAEGFGPGVNGPMFVAVQLPAAGDQTAVGALSTALNADPGVALAAAAPVAPDAEVGVIQVFPTTAPQDEATTDLLFHLRETVIPQADRKSVV